MECKARVKSIARDFRTGKVTISLELDDVTSAQLENIPEKDLRLTLKAWKNKRSLDANNYCWALMTEIALKLNTTKEEVYEDFIQKYAPWAKDENGYIIITVKADVDMDRIEGHWKRLHHSADGRWVAYAMLESSKHFDTATMSDFIEMVKDEAERLGIETATPDEIERMKATWKAS